MVRRCSECSYSRFIEDSSDGEGLYECRAKPPCCNGVGKFPTVKGNDWCGSFNRKRVVT